MSDTAPLHAARTRLPRVRGVPRERLEQRLAMVWEHRLALVLAPAGSGKTTLVGRFARHAGAPVAWYRPEAGDGTEPLLLAQLERAFAPAVEGVHGGWHDLDDALVDLEAALAAGPGRALLVVDELDALWGTGSEAMLERLIEQMPLGLAVVATSRRAPGFNLSRLRVAGDLLEIGADDLRFRFWEVEQLFGEFYSAPLAPEELAELTRRTEGWAAGLQLFHLATRGKPARERRQVLTQLGSRSRLLREYLAQNVVGDLPGDLQEFLLDTCVLGRLTASLCDAVRGAADSGSVLEQLERRQIFTHPVDADAWRYHEVLRSHLEGLLLEKVGEAEARRRYLRAARLLEDAGALADAVRSFSRAEAWSEVHRLLGGRGEEVLHDPNADWLDLLPPGMLDLDPWLLLGGARRHLSLGRWSAASEAYAKAETAFGSGSVAATCRRERQALDAWLEPVFVATPDWTGLLRRAVRADPLSVAHAVTGTGIERSGPEALLVEGLCRLLAGEVAAAQPLLEAAVSHPVASPVMQAVGAAGGAVALALAGDDRAADAVVVSAEHAEELGLLWLARLVRAARHLAGRHGRGETGLVIEKDDVWGSAAGSLLVGLASLADGPHAARLLAEAGEGFRLLGAGVLEAWALSAGALVAVHERGRHALAEARAAEAKARSVAAPGPLAVAQAALALAEGDAAGHGEAEAAAHHLGLGIALGAEGLEAVAPVAAPLVGRDRELGELCAYLDAAARGTGRLVVVEGEAGMGKTRLAEEVARRAEAMGIAVRRGHGAPASPPWWPWAQVVRDELTSSDLDELAGELGSHARALVPIVPEVAELFGLEGHEPAPDPAAIVAAVGALLTTGRRGPRLLVLDDAHLADAASARLLDALARAAATSPVLVVAVVRSPVPSDAPASAVLSELTAAVRLPLSGLDPSAVEALVARAVPGPLAADDIRQLTDRAGGNPFYVLELARSLAAGDPQQGRSAVPDRVRELVARQLRELSPACLDLIATAALLGREFRASVLAEAADQPAAVLQVIGEAVAAGVLVEVVPGAGRYRFRQDLVREVAEGILAVEERSRRHRRIAEALERLAAPAPVAAQAAEIAHHWLRANGAQQEPRVLAAVRTAVHAALGQGAPAAAAHWCEQALLVVAGEGERVELRRMLAAVTTAAAPELPAHPSAPLAAAAPTEAAPPVQVRVLGRFELSVGGRPVDLAGIKPRARAVLRHLALHAGRTVHREELVTALWPEEADPRTATRTLQVSVSSLRKVLEPDAGRGETTLLVRDGDGYRLALPAGSRVDLAALEQCLSSGRGALAAGDAATAIEQLHAALLAYRGELLPDDGPAEWVVPRRDALAASVAEAAERLAALQLERGDSRAAIWAAERGLEIDRWRDGLWRALVAAHEAGGDHAAAAQARRAYGEVLDELGLGSTAS